MQSVPFNCKTFLQLIVQPEEHHPGPLNDLNANDNAHARASPTFRAQARPETTHSIPGDAGRDPHFHQ
jgi:hypothetical protein